MSDTVRLDKWLWAARFFKTRALAADAIDGGKVHVNGTRGKRGKLVKVGDSLRIRKGPFESTVTLLVPSNRRGPAKAAVTWYEETAESRSARETLLEQHRLAKAAGLEQPAGKPTKSDRRLIKRFKQDE